MSLPAAKYRWELLEEMLFDVDMLGYEITNEWIARTAKHRWNARISNAEASRWIQSYLAAQRTPKSRTLYVLKRKGRTAAATWTVGQRTVDERRITRQFADDVKRTFKRAVQPDLIRIATINPRSRTSVEAKIDAIAEGALVMLVAACDGYLDGD